MVESSQASVTTSMKVEVAYGSTLKQFLKEISLPIGSQVKDAILVSGVCEAFPEIQLEKAKVGIFGKLAKLTDILSPFDRVEIYRPLLLDPKEARRQRANRRT